MRQHETISEKALREKREREKPMSKIEVAILGLVGALAFVYFTS